MSRTCKPITDVGLGIVLAECGGRREMLITRRPETTVYAGYWEFPGGKVDADETPAEAVVRELAEELAITVRPVAPLPTVEHVYDHAHVRLYAFICVHEAGRPENRQVADHRWIDADELARIRFPEANAAVVAHLRDYLAKDRAG